MITLILLHPIKLSPVQSWTFENEQVIRIGRATDNQVVLYSAVVSRLHVELRRDNKNWEIVNVGANGTYLDGERISRVPAVDGAIIRLARSGPQLQICLGALSSQQEQKTTSQQTPVSLTQEDLKETLISEPKATQIEK